MFPATASIPVISSEEALQAAGFLELCEAVKLAAEERTAGKVLLVPG
jgi:hypothetical protein